MTHRDLEYLERHIELAYIRLRDLAAKEQDAAARELLHKASAACAKAVSYVGSVQ